MVAPTEYDPRCPAPADTDWVLTMPGIAPTFGSVRLRAFEPRDAAMVRDLSSDHYVPLTGTLAADATTEQAHEWIERQHRRLVTGAGYSFCIADRHDDPVPAHAT